MRICKKCSQKIPYRYTTSDGVVHIIPKRTFCFQCSPFGERVSKTLMGDPTIEIRNGIKYRICTVCKIPKVEDTTHYFQRKRGGFHSYCRPCMARKTIERQRETKKQAVEYKGGKCQICGYNKYFGSLDFHHLNPSTKDWHLSDFRSYCLENIKKEIDKCILVCSNCHGEIHGGLHPELLIK